MVVVRRVIFARGSKASQAAGAAGDGETNSATTPPACRSAPARRTTGRRRFDGTARATAASARGARMTKSIMDIASIPQRRELLGVERGELAVDVEHHDAHQPRVLLARHREALGAEGLRRCP